MLIHIVSSSVRRLQMDLCDKFITSHVYVLSKHQQGKCAASVPTRLFLAKIVLQDLNAFGTAPQLSMASWFSSLFIP